MLAYLIGLCSKEPANEAVKENQKSRFNNQNNSHCCSLQRQSAKQVINGLLYSCKFCLKFFAWWKVVKASVD